MSYQTRLAEAITVRKSNTTAVAAAARVKYQAVAQVLNGSSKMLRADSHSLACAFLRIDPVWLATGEGFMESPTIRVDADSLELVNLIGSLSSEIRERVIGYIDALRAANNDAQAA